MTNKEFRNQYKTKNWNCDEDKNGDKNEDKNYDIAAYPFGADEMLLKDEFKQLNNGREDK